MQGASGDGKRKEKSTGFPHIPQIVCVAYIFFLFFSNAVRWVPCWSGRFCFRVVAIFKPPRAFEIGATFRRPYSQKRIKERIQKERARPSLRRPFFSLYILSLKRVTFVTNLFLSLLPLSVFVSVPYGYGFFNAAASMSVCCLYFDKTKRRRRYSAPLCLYSMNFCVG